MSISQNRLILSLETSGRIGSAAIAKGPELLDQLSFSAPMRHSSEIFPAICRLLEKFGKTSFDIEQIYISAGPGSFTGLRIASTIAKIMGLANAIKIVAVDTLDVIAANAEHLTPRPDKIAVILDAKRSKFFIAAYENIKGQWYKTMTDRMMTAMEFHEEFDTKNTPISLLGEGLMYYKSAFNAEKITFLDENYWTPQAKNVHQLGYQKALQGQFADPVELSPIYLRKPV